MVNRALFSSTKQDWRTPEWLFDALNNEFNFEWDLAADKDNALCEKYYTIKDNSLLRLWQGRCYCNPPYGRDVYYWVKKAKVSAGNGNIIVMLLPARTDTKWFHEFIYQNSSTTIRFIKGRLKFSNAANSATFPSMIVIFE